MLVNYNRKLMSTDNLPGYVFTKTEIMFSRTKHVLKKLY